MRSALTPDTRTLGAPVAASMYASTLFASTVVSSTTSTASMGGSDDGVKVARKDSRMELTRRATTSASRISIPDRIARMKASTRVEAFQPRQVPAKRPERAAGRAPSVHDVVSARVGPFQYLSGAIQSRPLFV